MRTSFTRKFSVTALALGSKITEQTNTMMTPTTSSIPPTKMVPARELTLQCSDGMVLAAQQWTSKASPLDDREGETRVSATDMICLTETQNSWLTLQLVVYVCKSQRKNLTIFFAFSAPTFGYLLFP